jgi:hypothetical protein
MTARKSSKSVTKPPPGALLVNFISHIWFAHVAYRQAALALPKIVVADAPVHATRLSVKNATMEARGMALKDSPVGLPVSSLEMPGKDFALIRAAR